MNDASIVLAIILTPTIGSILLPVVGKIYPLARNVFALIQILVSLILSLMLVPQILSGNVATVTMSTPFGVTWLHADALAVFMAIVSSLVGSIIVLYSFGYISHYENQNEYYFMVLLFLGSMMGLIFSANLILLFIFWEITAIASWRLIGFFREKDIVMKADKAFLVTVFGALLMLLGFLMIFQQTGSFDLSQIRAAMAGKPISDIAFFLILLGILSKSATLPLHTWLPDAGVAPSPVTALLHAAVLVKIGVYVFARLFVATIPMAQMWHTLVPALAGFSALISAGAAMVETNMKRVIAYSTVSQIGFIFLGLAIGNGMGVAGGLLYILMHGISKGGLFLCAGIIEQATHTKDIRKMGGLLRQMPITAASFLLCAFSVMGIPPFGGFFGKYMVIAGAVESGQNWLAVTFVLGAILTIIYLFRLFSMIFMGEPHGEPVREGSPVMLFSVAILAVLSLTGGIFISSSADLVRYAVNQMGMMIR